MGHLVIRDIPRPDPDLVERLRHLPASAYAGPLTLGAAVALDAAIKPVRDDMRLIGPAFTVMVPIVDHLMPMYATTLARAGDVLMVEVAGRTEAGIWGAGMNRAAMLRGIAGVVIDGAVFDKPRLREMDLPVFARGASPVSSTWQRPGSINIPVRCGGKIIHPGDLVVADGDGVIVVPSARLSEIVELLSRFEEEIERRRGAMREGNTLFEALGLAERIEKLHIQETESE